MQRKNRMTKVPEIKNTKVPRKIRTSKSKKVILSDLNVKAAGDLVKTSFVPFLKPVPSILSPYVKIGNDNVQGKFKIQVCF